jgi:hypothetical protein
LGVLFVGKIGARRPLDRAPQLDAGLGPQRLMRLGLAGKRQAAAGRVARIILPVGLAKFGVACFAAS